MEVKTNYILAISILLVLIGCDFEITPLNNTELETDPANNNFDSSLCKIELDKESYGINEVFEVKYLIGNSSNLTTIRCGNDYGYIQKKNDTGWVYLDRRNCRNGQIKYLEKNNIYSDTFNVSEYGRFRIHFDFRIENEVEWLDLYSIEFNMD